MDYKNQYDIIQDGDTITVKYTVGNPTRVFQIPSAFPESRLEEYTSQLEDKMQQMKIKDLYKLYDAEDPDDFDEENTLEAMTADYPAFAESTKVYVLRTGLPDFQKEELEEIL